MKMSDVDLLIESTINEAPVGMLKRGALKVASKLGSQKAAGQEVTANIANQLKKEYSRYLGVTGYEPDKESIEAFLNSKGLSSDSLDTAISSVSATGPTDQDWRIDTGARTGATNQRVEPVVDIGSATDEVPALDGASPIEQARAKRIAAQQKAGQQLKGQQPEPTDTVKSTGGASSLQQIRAKLAASNPNRLAGMGAGYVPPTEPTAQEPAVAQPEPSATGTQAASALGRLKTPQNPMKGRTSLVSKIKGQQAAPEVPAQEPTATRERPGISARAGKAGVSQPKVPQFTSASAMSKATAEKKAELDTKLQAIDDAKAALTSSPRSGKLKDALKQAEADYDAFVSSEIKPADLKDKLATKVDQIKTGTTANTTPSDQLELPVNDAEPNQQTSTSSDANQDKIKKAQTEVDNKRAAFEIAKRDNPNLKSLYQDNKNGFMGRLNIAIKALANLTGEEPELETKPKPVSLTSTTDDVTKKAGKQTVSSQPSGSDDIKQSSADVSSDEKPTAKSASKSENTDLAKRSAELIAAVNAYNKNKSDEDLKHAVAVAKLRYTNAMKAAESEDDESDTEDNRGGLSSELNRFAKASDQVTKDKENDKKTNDTEQKAKSKALNAYNDALNAINTGKQTTAKQNKLDKALAELEKLDISEEDAAAEIKKQVATVSDSIEHEFDYLLAEAALTNKQVDKIILAVTQDNIRKGIISIPGVPQGVRARTQQAQRQPQTQRPTAQPAAASMGGSAQYTQPREQPVGGKSLDLSDFNVDRLIGAINHLMKKEELQRYEERQLKKLLDELKALR